MDHALTDEEILIFFQGLERSVGVNLDLTKKYLLNARLQPVVATTRFSSVDSFVRELNLTGSSALHEKAYSALTTNETMFFRDPLFFKVLKEYTLPNLIKTKSNTKTVRIWSAAASTGQEVYSLGMLIQQYFPELANWNIQILGSDISEPVLEKAKKGIFNHSEIRRGLPQNYLTKFFKEIDDSKYQISDSIRKMVEFKRFNLIKDPFPKHYFDLILLRNVLIYFSPENKFSVLRKSGQALIDTNGILFLGGAESINGHTDYTVNLNPHWTFYSKKG